MPQSLAKIYVHLIFSTKNRERSIPPHIAADLHSYMGGILCELGCNPVEINSEPDHAHLLFTLSTKSQSHAFIFSYQFWSWCGKASDPLGVIPQPGTATLLLSGLLPFLVEGRFGKRDACYAITQESENRRLGTALVALADAPR